ncbi:unnamed protein product (macronuclear) [Paramecium tetraurelia]|uniref:Uncharacterized protein n=1 Tax=Paramecium tetraurelia TaxID=5888 RepID=A0EBF1_PARTE|nr:uncharacterized protein GSPATT00025352001 [Paramecium tetraurelia]CAK92618.1 unnamed protein product [Paramecium tetraurelia]|eukprot:XP_001460015.1 hypothetical protein (macronuclear) [Paramecium tetraurelia strain d4-2]
MGCSQTKTKQSILANQNYLQSIQNEAKTQQNFEKDNVKYNILKNPIIRRRTERKNKLPNTTACTPTSIQ